MSHLNLDENHIGRPIFHTNQQVLAL